MKRFALIMMLSSISQYSLALSLNTAAICDGNPSTKSTVELDAGKVIGSAYKAASINAGRCIGWTNVGSGSTWYEFTKKYEIHAIDVATGKYIKSFPLTRTADDNQGSIRELSVANSAGSDETSEYSFMMGTEHDALGCLWDTPLRYGDIEPDGQNEIVAILGHDETQPSDRRLDMVIFSPQKQAVSFSIRLAREDIGGTLVGNFPDYIKLPNPNELPQLISTDMRGIGNPAMRYYAKLFFGDFDKNNKPDIIAWRKRYDSRPVSDTVQGYSLSAQLLTHYELINGLYKVQPTDEATIKTWLTDNTLTWKKGYPDVSECAADNDGPIPEMSDPLLNDPEVLQ